MVDVAIGTTCCSPDVAFKDLGLVIIDEEHRFGVKQKERIKTFRDTVDVLALSATPIPRTLGSALGGLKGLSVIEPPEGRQPIATHVGPFDPRSWPPPSSRNCAGGPGVLRSQPRRVHRKSRDALAAVLSAHGPLGPHRPGPRAK